MKLYELTIHEAHELLVKGEVSTLELLDSVLSRIEEVEGKVKAFITITPDIAREQAKKAQGLIKEGLYITGIPCVIKDNICTKGIRTTCGSKILENFIPPYSASVYERLLEKGCVLVGKANMDEFAMGSSTENSAFFPTRNPWDLERVPGGSSGGSAAAVSAGEGIYSLGSDTGGSVRQPASFCNLVGMKPTYGRVSRYGLVAFASSLDQIGPITKDVMDCAIVMNEIAFHDRRDSTSIPQPTPDYLKALIPDIKGVKIGSPREYFEEGVEEHVKASIFEAVKLLEDMGGVVEEMSLPHTKYALPSYYIIAPSEASANLARYDGVKYGFSWKDADNIWEVMEKTRGYGFGPEVKRRIMLGTYALSKGYYDAYYLKAQKVRTIIKREFEEAFKKYDVLITPTSPTVPFKIGEKIEDPLRMYMSDICTIPINIAGLPAISIPCGFHEGLPIGMQIIGPPLGEEIILRVAYTYEGATNWRKVRPRL